jgi:uncharacterized metal-binding protein
MNTDPKVIILPCSGIGKSYGSISREAAFILTETLRPEATQLMALSLLVMGDEETAGTAQQSQFLTIDGCKLACASKMACERGGHIIHQANVLDVHRRHRQLRPQGISVLNEDGLCLARFLAEELASVVDTSPSGGVK